MSGPLYGALGPRAIWAMALLCAAALPIAFAMRRIPIDASESKATEYGTTVVDVKRTLQVAIPTIAFGTVGG